MNAAHRASIGGHDLSAELNAEQYEAVTTDARHALVIAGAGSGKTRTLTYRVARLLASGVPAWRILLLTFTNKAAKEMLERVRQLAGMEAGDLWGGTFHSVANRILRRHAGLLGYRQGFTILDSDDMKAIYRALTRQIAGKMKKTDHFPKPELLMSLHSLAANTGQEWQDVLYSRYPHLERHEDRIAEIYREARARKRESNAMDFDDLLLNLLTLLREHPDVCDSLQHRFLHVLVDEYQDTNTPQEEIISLLAAGEHTSLMAVGDDAQSIYSWRGANVDHIFDFRQHYPDARIYKIETNYRSVPAILEISNAAIAQNDRQFSKVLRPAREGSSFKPVVVPAPDNRMEAHFVARRIDELLAGGIPPHEIAVLYRAHFHSMDIQMELARAHIPYRITSGLRFFEQAHVKDIVAWLRLLSNPRDEVAFRRIVSTFPHVGEVTAGKWWQAWHEAAEAWFAAHPEAAQLTDPHTEIMSGIHVPAAAQLHWRGFLASMDSLHPEGKELTPAELISRVQQFMDAYMRNTYDNYEERMEDLEQLSRSLADLPDLEAFLSQVALLSEVDHEMDAAQDCITLSTIHQAKGLEWKAVFVIFLADGLFPHYRVLNEGDPHDMEEETRLFYVAVTRAKDQLYLTYPRYNGNSYNSPYSPPSRFLTSLPEELYDLWNL